MRKREGKRGAQAKALRRQDQQGGQSGGSRVRKKMMCDEAGGTAKHIREGWGVLFRFIPRASGKQWAEGGGYELRSNNTHLFSLNRIRLTAKCKMHWREHKMNVKARRLASGYRPRREMLKTQTRKPRSSSDGFPEGLPTPSI